MKFFSLPFFFISLTLWPNLSLAEEIAAAPADSWPMYRGSSSLTGLSKSKLGTELKQLWSFKAEEGIHSTAAIVDNKVFVGCDDGNLYALDFKNGKKIWEFKTEDIVESAPLVKDGRVYFGSSDGFVYALSSKDGKLQWKFETAVSNFHCNLPSFDERA